MSTHRIHLKGPWQYKSIAGSEGNHQSQLLAEGTVKLPATWQTCFGDFQGTIRFARHFNCPTNLDAEEQVFVILTQVGGEASVNLNGTPLGSVDESEGPFEFEITSLLEQRNLLAVEVTFDPQADSEAPGGLWSPVAIEIRSGP